MSWLIEKDLWLKIFDNIKQRLDLTFELDQVSTDILSSLLSKMDNTISLDLLRSNIRGERVLVFGCGPNLQNDLKTSIKRNYIKKYPIIVADGASTLFAKLNIIPRAIVTDLDGDFSHIQKLNQQGSIAVVHAHGDNINDVKNLVPKLKGPIIGSTQVEPRPHVYNFGGFTDGDRALFLAYVLGIRDVILGGMKFDGPIGKFSLLRKDKKKDIRIKLMKLEVAKELIKILIGLGMNIKCLSPVDIDEIKGI